MEINSEDIDMSVIAASRLQVIKKWMRLFYINIQTGLGRDGRTCLHDAALTPDFELVALLLESGAIVNGRDRKGKSALHLACSKGHLNNVVLLLHKGASVHCEERYGYTPLHMAAKKGHLEIADLLLQNGARISHGVNENETPLYLAASNGHEKLVRFLLLNGADAENKCEPLLIAAENGHTAVVATLLEYGADPECMDKDYVTPLRAASDEAHFDIVKLLLEKGANPNNNVARSVTNNDPSLPHTPLEWAAYRGSRRIVNLLMDYGASIVFQDSTALHFAAMSESVDVCEDLLKAGAQVNVLDQCGNTPLHFASNAGIVELLVSKGADIDSRNFEDHTPLVLALPHRNADVAVALLQHGSDINKVNNLVNIELDADRLPFLSNYIMKMKSVNLYLCENIYNEITEVAELDVQCQGELEKLKVTPIGNSDVTYFKFLGKNIDRLTLTLENEEILKTLCSESYKTEFPLYSLLISNRFQKGRYRKILIDQVLCNCSEIFAGLLKEVIEKILSFFSNKELSRLADGFRPGGVPPLPTKWSRF